MGMLEELQELKACCSLTEDQILGDIVREVDHGAEFLGQETYVWYYVLGQYFRPKSILEIGTRYGYSLKCLVLGSGVAETIWSYDSEYDFVGSIDYVQRYFARHFPFIQLHAQKVNTRYLQLLPQVNKVDLAHVDADHSEQGSYEDCLLSLKLVRSGGVLLVDDMGFVGGDARARAGADRFCRDVGLKPLFLHNFRGIYVIPIP
jgi:predicted O-methyltransferase YrrM